MTHKRDDDRPHMLQANLRGRGLIRKQTRLIFHMELCDVSRLNLFLTGARGFKKASAKFIGWYAKLSLECTREGFMCFESGIQCDLQNGLIADLQTIRGSFHSQAADILLHRLAKGFTKDTMEMIGRKPDASCQHIQVQIPFEMGLNVDERGEDRLLVLFVGRENHS